MQGKQAILLVPEIALTPQIVGQFQNLFGNAVVVMHSALTDRQRQDAYQRMQNGTAMSTKAYTQSLIYSWME